MTIYICIVKISDIGKLFEILFDNDSLTSVKLLAIESISFTIRRQFFEIIKTMSELIKTKIILKKSFFLSHKNVFREDFS